MFTNDYRNEELHLANWLLLSGFCPIEELYQSAKAQADQDVEALRREEPDISADDIFCAHLEWETSYLADSIQEALSSAIEQALPGADFESARNGGVSGYPARAYQGATPIWLMLSLIGPTLERIDLGTVAGILADHFMVPAERAAA